MRKYRNSERNKAKKVWITFFCFMILWSLFLSVKEIALPDVLKTFLIVGFMGIISAFFLGCGYFFKDLIDEKEKVIRELFFYINVYVYAEILKNMSAILNGREIQLCILDETGPAALPLIMTGCVVLIYLLKRVNSLCVLLVSAIVAFGGYLVPVFGDFTTLYGIVCFFWLFYLGYILGKKNIVYKFERLNPVTRWSVSVVIAICVAGSAHIFDFKGRVLTITDMYSLFTYPSYGRAFFLMGGLLGIVFWLICFCLMRGKDSAICSKINMRVGQLSVLACGLPYFVYYYSAQEESSGHVSILLAIILGICVCLTMVLRLHVLSMNWRLVGWGTRIQSEVEYINEKWKNACSFKKKGYYIKIYTIVFIFVGFWVFKDFIQQGRSLVWKPDGVSGYYGNLIYLRRSIMDIWNNICSGKGLDFSSFDFSVSLGRDVSQRFISTIFNPIQIVACFWPIERIELLYVIGIILRYYFTGLAFSVYVSRFKRNLWPTLLGAILYTFCGFAIFAGLRHPFMQGMMAVFPLLLVGIEKVLNKESPVLLILMTFFGTVLSIYTLYMMTIVAFIYALIRFFNIYQKHRVIEFLKCFFSCVGCYALGALMGAVTWIPTMFGYAASGRIGNTETLDLKNLLSYGKSYYEGLVKYFVAGDMTIGSWTCLGFSVIAVPMLIILFLQKSKKEKWTKELFIVFSLLLCIPIFGFMTSGFNNIFNRWCFAYGLCIALIIVFQIEKLDSLTKREIKITSAIILGYILLLLWMGNLKTERKILYSVILLFIIILIMFGFWSLKKKQQRFLLKCGCYFVSIISVIVNADFVYGTYGDNYAKEFSGYGKAYGLFVNSAMESVASYLEENEDDSFYRVGSNDVSLATDNSAALLGVNGLSDFNSAEVIYNNYLIETENSGIYDTTVRLGMDNRAMQLALASVKYYGVSYKNKNLAPYGYSRLDTVKRSSGKKDIVYINENALPLGYTYNSYISREDYEELSALDRQEALMQSVLLEEDTQFVGEKELDLTSHEQQINSIELSDIEWEGDELTVSAGGTMTISFEQTEADAEVYVRLIGYGTQEDNTTLTWTVSAKTDGVSTKTVLTSAQNPYTTRTEGRLINLGSHEDGINEVVLGFASGGDFLLESVEIWSQPMDHFVEQVNELKEEALENISMIDNTIQGNITVSEDKVLCLSIPYSSVNGWDAYIDGQPVELLQANTVYMGILLEPGEHTLFMEYHSPGVKECAVISLTGICIFIIFVVFIIIKKKKKDDTNEKENIYSKRLLQ